MVMNIMKSIKQMFDNFTNRDKDKEDYEKKRKEHEQQLLDLAPENLDYDPEGLRDIIEDEREGEEEEDELILSTREHPLKSKKEGFSTLQSPTVACL